MEEILKEILYELKEIRKETRVTPNNPSPVEMKTIIGEDTIVDIINKEMRKSGQTLTVV